VTDLIGSVEGIALDPATQVLHFASLSSSDHHLFVLYSRQVTVCWSEQRMAIINIISAWWSSG